MTAAPRVPVFDLDGTLVDSDGALADAFMRLGVERAEISFGHVLAEECDRLGLSVESYLDAYDESASKAFEGMDELLARLERFAVCSNKHPRSGTAELRRLGWTPEVALFADAFAGPKRLEPVLDLLGLGAADVVFVGDTVHDRGCALEVGCVFVLAGWNPRALALFDDGGFGTLGHDDAVLRRPGDLLELL